MNSMRFTLSVILVLGWYAALHATIWTYLIIGSALIIDPGGVVDGLSILSLFLGLLVISVPPFFLSATLKWVHRLFHSSSHAALRIAHVLGFLAMLSYPVAESAYQSFIECQGVELAGMVATFSGVGPSEEFSLYRWIFFIFVLPWILLLLLMEAVSGKT